MTKQQEEEYDRTANNIDWADIFFKLGHYLHFDKHQIWNLTLPQLELYMGKIGEHIDFTVKVHSLGMLGLFGGSPEPEQSDVEIPDNTEHINGYKVLDSVEDLDFLASMLSSS